ncbi:hypothetical protein BDAP_000155 [Binucleata daphniae]
MQSDQISITLLLEKIDDIEFYTKHNNEIIEFVNKPETLKNIEDILHKGKKYSLLKLIEKTGIKIDNELYLKYLNNDVNYNYNLYELIFTLFLKELIDKKCLETFRNKFANHFCGCDYSDKAKVNLILSEHYNKSNQEQNVTVNNKSKQFYMSIKNVEEKVMKHKIECDRYFMKKRMIQNCKITDRQDEIRKIIKYCGCLNNYDFC